MNDRSFFNLFSRKLCPIALFSERRDGSSKDGAPISDDAYRRIPDKFKTPPPDNSNDSANDNSNDSANDNSNDDANDNSNDDAKNARNSQKRVYRPRFERESSRRDDENRRPNFSAPPRSPLPNILLVVAILAIVALVYNSFFSEKTTEISWTALNTLLDENQVASANLKGTRLSGELRSFPPLIDWPQTFPHGRKMFEKLIEDYDRRNSDQAKTLATTPELSTEVVSSTIVVREQRPVAQNGETSEFPQNDEKTESSSVSQTPLKEIPIPPNASDAEIDALRKVVLAECQFGQQLEQRWMLLPLKSGNAVELVEKATEKRTGILFFKKYICEAPAFAFSDPSVDARFRSKLDSYTSTTPSDNTGLLMLFSIAVSVFFLFFIFRMMRRANEQMMNGGAGGFGNVTKSLAKEYEPDDAKRVTFADAAGMDAVKAELIEIVDYLKNPEKYERMGARVPKGTLLFGPPGTGKTLLARAVAGEANVPFYSINGSEFIQMFVGVGASRVRDLFARAKENAPSILFIDEIDAVGRQRGAGVGGGQDEREQTLNQILSEMDGFTQSNSVMVMASTNRPDVLDPALMRPGRFDRHIVVGRPSLKGRLEIFNVYLKKIPLAADVDVDSLAKKTVGFTGADIRNFVNEATLWATRNNKTNVGASDFDFAFEKIEMGLKRDEIVSPKEKRKTAYHEAGHALVGWFFPVGSTVHKITIVPRGQALGATWFLPEDDKMNYNETEIRATLARFLAGRAAEKIVYNESSAGAENDLKRATDLARNMIVHWGMSERLGPVAFRNAESHPFLGREMTADSREYGEETARIIDEEIVRVMREADEAARNTILEKRELFEKLTEALVAEEELDFDRIVEILGPAPKELDDEQEAVGKIADIINKDANNVDNGNSPAPGDGESLVDAPPANQNDENNGVA